MSEYIVDGLEAIKIHEDKTHRANRASGDDVSEVPLQSTTIHQPGERIMEGGKPQPGFGSSECADILHPAPHTVCAATRAQKHRPTIGQGAVSRCKRTVAGLIKHPSGRTTHQSAKRERPGTARAGVQREQSREHRVKAAQAAIVCGNKHSDRPHRRILAMCIARSTASLGGNGTANGTLGHDSRTSHRNEGRW
jgi:hypothetical protein